MNNFTSSWLFRAAHRQNWEWRIKSAVLRSKRSGSNLLSYAVRPLLSHARLRLMVGAIMVFLVIGTTMGNSDVFATNTDIGGPEVVLLNAGEPNVKTIQGVRLPLEKVDVSQGFWALHSGIDMRAPIGTPIYPIMAGNVIQAENTHGGYGNLVVIKHQNGYQTWYGHMSKIKTRVGDNVTTGMIIGEVGSTGRSTGPHLHLELREDTGRIVNPGTILGIK